MSLLVVFSTQTVTTQAAYGSLGSESGTSGDTLFRVMSGAGFPSDCAIQVGGTSGNRVLESSGLACNDGRLHAALGTYEYFKNDGSERLRLFVDGRLVVEGSASSPLGTAPTFEWVVSGGWRRGGSDNAGAECKVPLVLPFDHEVSIGDGRAYTANPWSVYEPRRASMGAAAAAGIPVLSAATVAAITTTTATPRVSITF